jgi:hypothetical protein
MRILRFFARVIFVVACVVAIVLLGRSFAAEAGVLSNQIAVNNREAALRASLPGTATALYFENGTLAVQRTNQPTNTPTQTEPPEPTFPPEPTEPGGPDLSVPPQVDATETPRAARNLDIAINVPEPIARLNNQITTDTPVPTTAPTKPGAISTNTPRPTVTTNGVTPTAAVTATSPAPVATTPAPQPTGSIKSRLFRARNRQASPRPCRACVPTATTS